MFAFDIGGDIIAKKIWQEFQKVNPKSPQSYFRRQSSQGFIKKQNKYIQNVLGTIGTQFMYI